MAQELNFDELDHAVSQYMQQKDQTEPTPGGAESSPPVTSSAPSPAPVASVVPASASTPVSAPAAAPSPAASADARAAHMHIAPRRTLVSRSAPSGRATTFHDIAPPRRSPTTPGAHVQPLAATRPAPKPAYADVRPPSEPTPQLPPLVEEKPAEKEEPATPLFKEPEQPTWSPVEPVVPPSPPAEVATWDDEPQKTSEPELPEDSIVVPDTASASATQESAPPAQSTFGTSSNWTDHPAPTDEPSVIAPASMFHSPPAEVEDEDLASLDKITARPQPLQLPTDAPASAEPANEAPVTPPTPTPEVSSSPTEPQSNPAPQQKTAWPSTAGLLDTGELHAQLSADESGMKRPVTGQVFDNTPYHEPIQGHTGTSPARTVVIILLIVVFVLIAGVAVFMYVS